ncbi:MAG: PHB depolymerase family esterase [Xanthobacter sp.]
MQMLCLFLFGGLMPAHAGELTEHRLQVGGETRSYLMLQPQGAPGPRPVVIGLHGAGQSAEGFRGYFGLDETARANDFVAVYPQGDGRVWDDGRPAAMRLTGVLRPGDDVPFLVTLAHKLVQEGIADPSRIYLVGISNGGFMVERMACEFSHVFAAYTVIMATAPTNYREECRPSRPVPIMFIHGTADSVIAYAGFWTPLGATLSAPDSAALFARLNGCGAATKRSLPDRDKWDGTSVSEQSWTQCREGSKVRFLTVERGGHQSPARVETDMSAAASFLGLRNRDIDAGQEAWQFMSAFSLPKPKAEEREKPVAASSRNAPSDPSGQNPSAYAPQMEGRASQPSGGDAGGTSLW